MTQENDTEKIIGNGIIIIIVISSALLLSSIIRSLNYSSTGFNINGQGENIETMFLPPRELDLKVTLLNTSRIKMIIEYPNGDILYENYLSKVNYISLHPNQRGVYKFIIIPIETERYSLKCSLELRGVETDLFYYSIGILLTSFIGFLIFILVRKWRVEKR